MPADPSAILKSGPSARVGGTAQFAAAARSRERLLLNAVPIGMLLIDETGCCIDANAAALELLDLSQAQVIGKTLNEFLVEVAELLVAGAADPVNGIDVEELHVQRANGSELIIELSASRLDCPREPVTVYFFREISDEIALAEQLRETALTDSLTRLPNRYALEQQVDLALRNISRGATDSVLCFLDLDNFKSVNDTCGHAAGDALLQMVAEVFRQRVRSTDAVGRIGGDEFALLLNGCHLEDAIRCVAELRRRILNLDFSWDGHAFRVGLSAGLTTLTRRTTSIAEALAEADMACFAAKSAGRCETRVFTDRLRAAGAAYSADADVARRLREALASGDIALNAQPLRALRGAPDDSTAAEVLMRMLDAHGQLIPPSVLLPIAARFGLAQQLDRWVVQQVIDRLDCHGPELGPGRFYVNITATSLVDESFVGFVAGLLSRRTAPRFGIEIAEGSLMLHAQLAADTVRSLHDLGCGISVDRISGRADALSFISELPVGLLKLGPEFAQMRTESDIAYIHAQALIGIARQLSRPVTVTGIETGEALQCARTLGAQLGQGVAIAPPTPFIVQAGANDDGARQDQVAREG
jgi:Amt family ammonium transporter